MRFLLFILLARLIGNPIIAVVVILAFYLVIDRTYYGFVPDPLKLFRVAARIRELQRTITVNPHDARSLKELGIYMVEKKDYQKALEYFTKASSKMSDDPEFNYYYGIALARNGDLEGGRAMVDSALHSSPGLKYGDPYLDMAEVYIERGDYGKAIPLLEQFLKMRISSTRGFYQMGLAQSKLGNKDAGREYLKKAVSAFRGSPRYKRKLERIWELKAKLLLISMA